MGLNDTPAGNRIQIGFFGKRNAGKSSLVNAITGQNLAVVSEQNYNRSGLQGDGTIAIGSGYDHRYTGNG